MRAPVFSYWSVLDAVKGSMDLLHRYADQRLNTKAFLLARWALTPYDEIGAALPRAGTFLDAGCGHGLLSLALALQAPDRRVVGVDHDGARIRAAIAASADLSNVEFREGNLTQLSDGSFDVMIFMDVLHYLPFPKQEEILRDAYARLQPAGHFVFREVDVAGGAQAKWNTLHERMATWLGLTKADGLYFRTKYQWQELAESVGFCVQSQPMARFPFADVLFHCRK